MPASRLLSAALIHVLSLNIWGVPDVGYRVTSPFLPERMAGICSELKKAHDAQAGWDVVLIQEAWTPEERNTLKNCGYPYEADLEDSSRVIDSGLMILSRYPLKDVERLTYPAFADGLDDITDGEAFAHKSALRATVEDPAGPYRVADSHLISIYGEPDRYLEIRRAQMRSFVEWSQENLGTMPLILGGDLNFGPGTPEWPELKSLLAGFGQAPGAEAACTVCPPNVMHDHNEGKYDHLFGSPGLAAVEGGITLTKPIQVGGVPINLSDHFGWETTFSR
jgi:endonuclease/exonuclease/phosphatase family metal-dependent hydrolase